ncbi:MAG: SBBP repeat-containing protein, partial [Caldisericia bacterium]|nr:SBBP repeat-containing protein [Caldisericia bacterium]
EWDSEGNIYIGGETNSRNFPMKHAYQDTVNDHGMDAFLAKLSSDGQLLWSTYMGGNHEFWHSHEMNKMYGNGAEGLFSEGINCIKITDKAVYAGGYSNAESVPEFQYSSPHDYWFLNSFIAEFTRDGDFVRILEMPYIEDNGYLVLHDFEWVTDDTLLFGGLQRVWPENGDLKSRGKWHYCIASLHVGEENRVTINWKKIITTPGSSQGKYGEIDSLLLHCDQDRIYTAFSSRSYQDSVPYGHVHCYTQEGTLLWSQSIEAARKPNPSVDEEDNSLPSWTAIYAMTVGEQGIFVGGVIRNDGVLPKSKNSFPKTGIEEKLNKQGFVVQLSHEGTILQSRTFGGNSDEAVYDMALNDDGLLFVTGSTSSTDFPLVNPMQDQVFEKETGFIAILSPSLKFLFSTYWGGKEYAIPEEDPEKEYYRLIEDKPMTRGLFIRADSTTFLVSGYTDNNTFPLKHAFQSDNPPCPWGEGILGNVFLSAMTFAEDDTLHDNPTETHGNTTGRKWVITSNKDLHQS